MNKRLAGVNTLSLENAMLISMSDLFTFNVPDWGDGIYAQAKFFASYGPENRVIHRISGRIIEDYLTRIGVKFVS